MAVTKDILIIGGGLFAVDLANKLTRRENKIVMVVEDKEKALEISAKYGDIIVVNGNPLDPKILDELSLEECEIFISATEHEETNILSALYAKKAGVKRIFVKVTNPDTERIVKEMGVTPVNCDEHAASSVALKVLEPLVADLVGVGVSKFEIVEKRAEYYPNIIGKKINQVKGDFFGTLAIYHENEYSFLPDTKIKENSVLIVIREAGKRKEMRKAMKELFTK